ncbi:MAG: SusC/RagA family TonB-linked outer membrane protein [Chitinophagaceae bacterium]|nr:SusC/RagA family TonB-linked outer membrane protein [Chitinophagaceae bacterium]
MKLKLLLLWTVLVLSMPLLVFSQSRQVTGRITDSKGDAVPLASVTLKGTSTGTAADENGRFSINVSGSNPVLVISSVNFQTQEIRVGNSNNLAIELAGGTILSEVTVTTALGIKRPKRSLGYSAQEISGDALLQTKQTNIVNALRGQVAGVQINSGGGAPGQGSRIIIRGIKSLAPGKDNQPLFIIDGVQMDNSTTTVNEAGSIRGLSNRAADINPDDVESISVLRGGAATALYGQAGSNGVVVITTKSARAGKMRISFSSTYGIDEVNKFPEVQMRFSQGQNSIYNATEFFPSWGPTVEAAKALDPTHPAQLFHHYKRAYQQGNQFRNSLTLSGGNENALLTSSLSYFKQNGTIPNSDYKNISARVGAQFKISNKIKFNPSFYFINSGGLRVNADRFNESLTYWSPRHDVQDYLKEDGTMKTYGTQNNPIYATKTNNFRDNVNRIIGTGDLTYSPFTWLDFNYKYGMDFYTDFRRHTAPGPRGLVGEQPHADNGLGFVNEDRLNSRIITSNLMATLKRRWSDNFNTVLRVGNEVRDRKYSRLSATGSELDVPTLLTLNNAKVRNTTEYQEQYRIVSAYGDLTLDWKNYLFLNVTGRNDWSSTLPSGFNSFFYPSASLSYVFTDHFKKMASFLSYGKLRVSLAETGKDTDPYETSSIYESSVLQSTSQVLWSRGDARGDALLRPERTSTFEVGTELRFLKNRLGIDFNWYKLNSRDQIIPVSVSPTTGYTNVIINAGEIENKGIELVLNGNPIRNDNFKWDITVNFARNRNKVVSIREGLSEIVVGSQFGYIGSRATLKYVPGYAVGNIYGSTNQRYYGTKVDDKINVDYSLPLVIASSGTNAGFPVRDGTQRLLGNSQPDWTGGINNILSYKNLTLSFLWETQQGHEKFNQLGNFMAAFGISKFTENRNDITTFQGVKPDGTPNTQPVWLNWGTGPDGRVYSQGYYRNIYRSVTENFVEDASWIRLRNVSLSYSLPANILKRTFVQGATITFTGNNLLLFTDYSGYDPESGSFSAASNLDAFAGFTYPAQRSYLFSINLNF